MMINGSPTAEKVTQRIVERLLGGADERDSTPNPVDAVVEGMARLQGESVAAEQVQAIAEDARALSQKGTRLTA